MAKMRLWLLILLMVFLPCMEMRASSDAEEKLNASELVVEHIKDSYDWHVTDIGKKSIVIHLPIIVKSTTGWHVFSSSLFDEHTDNSGYRNGPFGLAIATEGENAGKIVEKVAVGVENVPLDISITKTVAVLMINSLILLFCILIPARWARNHKPSDNAPGGFIGFIEMLVSYVDENIVKAGVGKGYEKYSPYLLTCFFFIFFSNLLGVVPFPPGGGNLTGNITVTFFLAMCTFVITQFSGTRHYWKEIFWGDVPLLLKFPIPLIPLIEFVGIFTKPFALMIRLFANMMAGHAIALALTCIIFLAAAQGMSMLVGMTFVSVILSIFMMILEFLVCFIQAMVFTMLSATFIGLARAHHE